MKTCRVCNLVLSLSSFESDGRSADGYSTRCLSCLSKHRETAKEKARIHNLEKTRRWKAKNPEKWKDMEKRSKTKHRDVVLQRMSDYHERNKESAKIRMKIWYENNKEKVFEHRKSSINIKLSIALRSRINSALSRNLEGKRKPGSAVKDLGCTVEELKKHLESQWQEGMSWDNWALDGWHMDHIRPLASFDLSNRDEFLVACHYTNLQPLWAEDNLRKKDHYVEDKK